MKKKLAPILLFTYNRPHHVQKTILSLKRNDLFQQSELIIYSDGPKHEAERARIESVRAIIRSETKELKNVQIIEKQKNSGLAQSIISGVGEQIEKQGKAIVWEDDLICSKYTLQYLNDALDRYEKTDEVMHIGAFMFPFKNIKEKERAFFHPIATSWGWATWKNRWHFFEKDMDKLISQFDSAMIKEFSFNHTMNYWKQMLDTKRGKNDSWAIRWYASIFLRNGLCLHPSQSLTQNTGLDGSGTHRETNTKYSADIRDNKIVHFPTDIKRDEIMHDKISMFFRTRKGNIFERGWNFLRKLYGIFRYK